MDINEKKENCLPYTVLALMTTISAIVLLLAMAAEQTELVLLAIISIIVVKKHAVKCYGRKIDKFWLAAYLVMAAVVVLFEILRRS